jgi:hypothetical protein
MRVPYHQRVRGANAYKRGVEDRQWRRSAHTADEPTPEISLLLGMTCHK